MASKTSAPSKNSGKSNNSMSYDVQPREAFKTPVQPSDGGLNKIDPGYDPEEGTNDC